MTDQQVFIQYRERFGEALQDPPLSWGHMSFSTAELAQYGRDVLAAGHPIDWSDYLAPLPPGACS